MYDIISIGDTTVDVFLELDHATVNCEINKEICQLCINYADKIPVSGITEILAVGNSANNAVAASRLGMKAVLYTVFGDDDIGKKMADVLTSEGVSDEYFVYDEGKRSNYSTVINYQAERTILVYHEKRDYVLPQLADSKWLYLSSVGEGHEKLHEQVYEHVKKSGVKMAFNPGSHQIADGLEKLSDLISVTEIFFVNFDEAKRIFGDGNMKELLERIYEHGVKIVVITDGPKGSYVYDGEKMLHLGIYDAPVVERTGCGDAFASGFIGGMHTTGELEQAMLWGNANSTSVLQDIGAQRGLLSQEKISAYLEKYKDVIPQNYE